MATYTITITGNRKVEAIKQARLAYNASIPQTIPDPRNPDGPQIPNPDLIGGQQGYLQWLLDNAVKGWKAQYATQIDAALAPTEYAAVQTAQTALATAAGTNDQNA